MKIRFALLLLTTALFAQKSVSTRALWNRPFPPFRIIGNVYYVGAAGVSSFLITTPQGDILLDGGLPETAPLIERSVAKLGFRMSDVKYLLNSHAHYDHAGGLGALKRASHAQLVASGPDAETLNTGHQLSYGPGQDDTHFPAVKVDREIRDDDTISLAGTNLTAHLTPGHTKGCTTWSMPVSAAGKTYQVVFACSLSVAGNQLVNNPKYTNIVADYRASFAKMRALPCDVFLAAHAEQFDLFEKYEKLQKGGPNPFVDPHALRAYVADAEASFSAELQKQERASAKPSKRI